MNKTININLGGLFFHIDKNAYTKLRRYLDAIAKSLSDDPQGKNEIIADIEARISELLSERITDIRQVVNEHDIDEIIAIMGQPEDYAEAEEEYTNYNTYEKRNTKTKKFYRDGDNKLLGGVCAGFAHYIDIDVIWVRLLTLILMFGAGFGFILYIIMWILLPEAKTTAQKLEMEGEPVNIDNIEKKIRDEIENLSAKVKNGASEVSDKISSIDYEKLKQQSKSGLQSFIDTIAKIIESVFKVFGKFIGILLIIISGLALISFIAGLFSMGSFEILNVSDQFIKYPPFFYSSMLPLWVLTSFLFFAIGIPFFVLFVLGLRILSNNIKRISKTTSLVLLGVWILAVLGLSFSLIEYGTSRASTGTKILTESLPTTQKDTLTIKIAKNDNLDFYYDDIDNKSNQIYVTVKKSDATESYIEIQKKSRGRNRKKAFENARDLNYHFSKTNNELILDNYFTGSSKKLYQNEQIFITVFIPEKTTVYLDFSTRRFLYDIKNTTNIHDKNIPGKYYVMTNKGLDCLTCTHKQ
ncbi:PspC domain-containing protein [Tenacibaculum sp. UWU-22]|uniref:PspC domain-containing protein n=1 Tax=Tenacibaculum sp. UWU-22 TaxID=3234187 RepID=UPI0034DAC6AB